MIPTTTKPARRDSGGLQTGGQERYQSLNSLPRPGFAVNHQLLAQAAAAEQRALANAAWHNERAARYLAWCDSPWAAAQYDGHVKEAAYQEAIAARHRQIAAALGQVRP